MPHGRQNRHRGNRVEHPVPRAIPTRRGDARVCKTVKSRGWFADPGSHTGNIEPILAFMPHLNLAATITLPACLALISGVVGWRLPAGPPNERRPIQSNPIQSNPIQSNPIQSNPIQSNPIQSNPIQSRA